MAWHDILTRNIAWKAISILMAVLIWNAIYQVQSRNDPQKAKEQELKEGKPPPPKPINPLEPPTVSINRAELVQNFPVRIIKSPDDDSQYILEPAEVVLELASNADPVPNFASASKVKVLVDPETIPNGILSTNLNVRVFVDEDVILKNFNPKEVKVTRIIEESTTPTDETETVEKDSDKTVGEDSAE
jgi:hypothetical protein